MSEDIDKYKKLQERKEKVDKSLSNLEAVRDERKRQLKKLLEEAGCSSTKELKEKYEKVKKEAEETAASLETYLDETEPKIEEVNKLINENA